MSLLMPAVVSGYPNDVIVLHNERCWQLLQCVLIFARTYGPRRTMDSDLLPELSGETWVAATYLDEVTGDLPPFSSEPDLITAYWTDKTLMIVREWVRTGSPLSWSDCSGLSPELHSWHLQFGNLID